VNQVT